jgi:3-oxoisoapionate decarboxylase
MLNRREMLRLLVSAGAACALPPLARAAQTSTDSKRLGICSISYTLRWPAVNRGEAAVEETLQFVDYCRTSGAGGVQTSVRTEPGFAGRLRSKMEACGMYLEAQASLPRSDADLDRFESLVRAAKEAGASVIRTACLGGRRYETFATAKAFADFAEQAERWLTLAEPIVRKHRVRLAVENHKDWRVPELLGLLNRLSSEYIGVCVDTGNSIALLEDPVAVVEAYAPFAFSTHLKDMAVQEYEQGFLLAEVALGDGFLDLVKIVNTLRRAKPELQFNLEMLARDPLKVPCLAKPYWATFETLPGQLLASTLSMIRANPPTQPLLKVSGLSPEAKLQAEDRLVQRSLAYARNNLQL